MTIALTDKGLRNLSLPGDTLGDTRQDFSVRGRRGLLLRLQRSRHGVRKVFRYRFKRSGVQSYVVLGEFGSPNGLSVADINLLHAQCAHAAANAGDPRAVVEAFWQDRLPGEPVEGPTVQDVIDEFLRVVSRTRKRPEDARYLLNCHVVPKLGKRAAASITKRDLVQLFDGIVDRGSPVAANRVYSTLKQAFAVAADRDLIASVPPFPRQKPGGAEKARTRILTDDEVKTLWHGLDAHSLPVDKRTKVTRPMALALKLLLVTAQRRGELAGAQWQHIEEHTVERKRGKRTVTEVRRLWRIPETKSGREHVVPLSPLAWQLLEELREITGESEHWLPSQKDGTAPKDRERSITKVARTIRAQLEMAEWTPHDLRRTARTALARLGVTEAVAERVINHAPKNPMVAVYDQHSYLNEARDALDRWGAELCRIVSR
jgi:integrase